MKKLPFVLFLIIALSSCNNAKDKSVSVSGHGNDKEYLIHLKEISDTIILNLSDFAQNFSFIPLETGEECMLNSGTTYITSEFILIQKSNHGILQFDREGRFIRTLARNGKGPKEYTNLSWSVDENDQILYFSDVGKMNYFLCYDLKSGEYLGDIKKAIPGKTGDIRIMEDKTILSSRNGDIDVSDSPYILYYQDREGNIISGIPTDTDQNIIYSEIKPGVNAYNYHSYGEQTIYSIHNDVMRPYLRFDYGEKNPDDIAIGRKTISQTFDTREYFKFMKHNVTGVTDHGEAGSSYTLSSTDYILDKKARKVYYSENIYCDPTGDVLEIPYTWMLTVQENGLVHYTYQAIDLIKYGKAALNDPEFQEPYRSILTEVLKDLDENDNPVLLVGRLL